MMNENQQEIRALAFVIAAIRPAWPTQLIEKALTKSVKDFATLADDAIDAARNQSLTSPGVLTNHRRSDRPAVAPSPPPMERCTKCGRINDDWHNCREPKPSDDWHNRRRQLAIKYTHQMRGATFEARQVIADQWKQELNA